MTDRPLTRRQELFALGLASGMTQRAAYIAAGYSDRGSTHALDVKASALANKPALRARLDALSAALSAEVEWTREKAARELLDYLRVAGGMVRDCESDADTPANAGRLAIRAIDRLNKLYRLEESGTGSSGVVIVDDV